MAHFYSNQGFFIEYDQPLAEGLPNHVFCGANTTQGASCTSCGRPLLRFLAIDRSDPRLGLNHLKATSIPLLYCWRCSGTIQYRVKDDNSIEVLEQDGCFQGDDFPYLGYPENFPKASATFVPLTAEEQAAIAGINRETVDRWDVREDFPNVSRPKHQIGGEPFLVQGYRELALTDPVYRKQMSCRVCSRPMALFAAIADDCLDPRGFTGNSFVQVLFWICRECLCLEAENKCD